MGVVTPPPALSCRAVLGSLVWQGSYWIRLGEEYCQSRTAGQSQEGFWFGVWMSNSASGILSNMTEGQGKKKWRGEKKKIKENSKRKSRRVRV